MAIFKKLDGTTMYLRGNQQSGYSLYEGGYIGGTSSVNQTITSIVVQNAISHVGSCANMFKDCNQITSLDLSLFDTSNVTNMNSMFFECSAITNLYLSNFNTSNVVSMGYMFGKMTNLEQLNILFNTYNVVDMELMFWGCSSLETLDLGSFNTSNVANMSGMFMQCESIENLNLSKFNTSNCTDFGTYGMFDGCTSLVRLQIDNFVVKTNAIATKMFRDCSALTTIECLNTFNSTTTTNMFTGCTSLQGETSKGGISYNSSKTTGTYAKINGGYFTYPKRTIFSIHSGSGTITGSGTYDLNTEVTITFTPNQQNYNYLESATLTSTEVDVVRWRWDEHTMNAVSTKFKLTESLNAVGTFAVRNQYTISVTSPTYTIKGAGTYRYLDQPTLICELGGELITFEGWYEGSDQLSTQNPYKFVMPMRNLSLTIRTGNNPFTNENVRQFCLQNKDGAIYNLTSHNSKIYLGSPNGLGLSMGYSQTRLGNSADAYDEVYSFGTISGDIQFYGTRESIYKDYYDFARFITNSPIELWYKIPTQTNNVHHVPVEVTSLAKGEVQTDGILHANISMKATGFWKESSSEVSASTSTIEVLNDSDFDMGFEITLAKLNGTAFMNPRVTFNNGEEYGVIAFDSNSSQEFTSITINTKDGKQDITLENGDEVITNPFSFIDFSYADGNKQFPFPKLKKGYTTITFIYDGVGTEGKSYLISYDKEYASV